MNVLITGGCGFIGLNLIEALLKDCGRTKIRILDNLSVGTPEDLESVTAFRQVAADAVCGEPGGVVELVEGDILDRETTRKACAGIDAMVHLAANTGVMPSIENPLSDCLTNVIGTLNCLEAARINRVKRFVFASSGAPLGEQIPPVHEQMVPRPVSPYGASKLSGEGYCSAYYGSFGLETVVLRFGNIYGPHSTHKGSVVALFIRNLFGSDPLTVYGDGNQTRDFVYAADLVQAIRLALETPGIGGEVFQIATHREHTVGETASILNRLALKYLGRQSEIVYKGARKGEILRNFADIAKANQRLGFEPAYDFEKGLEETFIWFLGKGQ